MLRIHGGGVIRIAALLLIAIVTVAPGMAQTFGVPNMSNKPPSGPPVQIEDCKAGQDGGMILAKSDGSFEVTFTNEGAVTADLIRFQIELGSEQIFVRDAGKFSPGVTIKHKYRRRGGNVISSPLLSPAALHCAVAAVHFVDGSEWTPSSAASVAASNMEPSRELGDGYLGVKFEQQADRVYAALVMPASPAALAGMRQGDQIVSIDSNKIATVNDAIQLISGTPPGTRVELTVMRNGRALRLNLSIGKRPDRT